MKGQDRPGLANRSEGLLLQERPGLENTSRVKDFVSLFLNLKAIPMDDSCASDGHRIWQVPVCTVHSRAGGPGDGQAQCTPSCNSELGPTLDKPWAALGMTLE